MQHQKTRIQELFTRWFNGTLTAAERSELEQLSQNPEFDNVLPDMLKEQWQQLEPSNEFTLEERRALGKSITDQYPPEVFSGTAGDRYSKSDRRTYLFRTAGFRYAAVLLLIIGISVIVYQTNRSTGTITEQPSQRLTKIQPGGNKAVLILADGSTIALENAGSGTIAQQGNVRIVKLANGQIAYDLVGSAPEEIMRNTIATPKGGQYQLTLPDGTRVWLNAASSITYPTAFAGGERNIKITGEAYFEVAENKLKPFTVDVDGKSLIQVLGTHFNINSYTDESAVKATLLEGSIRVKAEGRSVTLLPGQQASIANGITILEDVDSDQAIAWKNGIFQFKKATIPEVMRQLSRWYNVDFKYEGKMTDRSFTGKIPNSLSIDQLFQFLKLSDIQCRIENNKVIVSS